MDSVRLLTVCALAVTLSASAYQAVPAQGVFGRIEANPSPETISAWEAQQQADPDNLQVRGSLLTYYANSGPVEKYFAQALWIVQHHPESTYARLTSQPSPGAGNLPDADFSLLKSAWEQALIDQADNGKVLYNAGLFFMRPDPVRAVHLLEQARQLDPGNQSALGGESMVYTRAYTKPTPNPSLNLTAQQVQSLQQELASSTDPALLVSVGSNLIRIGQHEPESNLKGKGTELINRAISLDPNNEKWKTAAERAAMAPPPPPPPPPGAAAVPNGPLRIGGRVAEANLIRKVDPVYPDLARAARVSGIVEFTAIISEEGQIENLQLVRGHPMLINSAREAVLQYRYKPTLLNGNAVRVITSISVPFEMPAQ